jgi:class 3 adenylate cyclase/tetratricopeptide (TPR) repeat protein
VNNFETSALTLTVQLDSAVITMALSDGRAMGRIVSLPLASGVLQAFNKPSPAYTATPQAYGADLFAQLFPASIRQTLQHSPAREMCLQLDTHLLDIPWELAFDGNHYLGEKFQVARRILSDAALDPAPRVDQHRETLKVLLLHGSACTPAHTAHGSGLLARLQDTEGLAVTAMQAHALEWELLLREADAHDVVHCIGPMAPQAPGHSTAPQPPLAWNALARQSKTAQLLVYDNAAEPAHLQHTHADWLHTACRRGAPVLVQSDPRGTPGHLDCLLALYRNLARGCTLGAAVHQSRADRLHGSDTSDRRWAPTLYGDAALVLQPAADRPALGDHLRQVTAVFCDLVDSTKLLGVWGAERYSDMLDSYHAACAGIVARWGGISDNPQGDDGMMCYFGIPLAYEDSVARALRAGLEILQAVAQLGVQVRIGVVTGNVVVKAGQPIGVSLHLAARLQSIALPGTLVTSESTRQIVKNKFIFEQLSGLPQLKGFALETTAYVVRGEAQDRAIAWRDGAPARTPFVGRDTELRLIEADWARVSTHGLQSVLVSGEAGMGKSRLVNEFRRGLAARHHTAVECRCTPAHAHSAFHPLIELLRHRLRLQDDDSASQKIDKIRHFLPADLVADDGLALIAALLSVPTDGLLPPPRLSAERQRQRTLDVLVAWLLNETRKGPVCLVLEDLQWVDPSTKEFFYRVVAEATQAPLLLLITLRTEQPPPHNLGFNVHEVPLKGLSAEATRAMILSACGTTTVPGEMVQLLADKADGVPLFIEESARMVIDLGGQTHSADATLVARFAVPTTIQGLLMARLDRLASAKQVAQVGATIGREFSLPLLQAILAHETSPIGLNHLPAQLAALVRSGLVVEKGAATHASYYFKHALVRDAAYGSLWERDRKRLHRTIANVVREQFLDLAQNEPELLAYHFAQSGNDAQALEYWERAARRAAGRSAHLEAINHLRNGLGLLARLPPATERERTELRLQLMLAGQLITTQGYGADQVGLAYERAAELCQRAGDENAQLKTLLGLEGYHFMRADFGRAHVIARQTSAMLGPNAEPARKIQLQWAVGNILFHQGEFNAAIAQFDTCLAAYDPLQHHPNMVQDPGVMCLSYGAWALWAVGKSDQALARGQQAVALAEQLEHKFSMGAGLTFCASVHLLRGETPQALEYAQRARDICQEGGFVVWLAYAQLLVGSAMTELADAHAGAEEMRQAYSLWISTGAVVTRPLYLALQAEGLARADRPDEGLAVLAQAFELVCRVQEHYYEAEVRRLTGDLILQSARQHGHNRDLEAQQWLEGALAFAHAHQHQGAALRSATSLARLWAAQGQAQEAYRVLKCEYDKVTEGFYTRDVQVANALLVTLQPADVATLA